MKPEIYVETSVFSYLAGRRSPQLIVAARQVVTRDWWTNHRSKYSLFISDAVSGEAASGDPVAARRRLRLMRELPRLEITDEVRSLASTLADRLDFPARAFADAVHIAVAAVNGMDYLATWNFKHMNNVQAKLKVEHLLNRLGYESPVICSPEELIGD